MTKAILIKDRITKEIVHKIDVTGKSENQINKVIAGLAINFDFDKYFIQEEAIGASSMRWEG